jgi:hypothetical protein
VLKHLAKINFPDNKSDLFACFMGLGFRMARTGGITSMITMQSWMFLSGYQKMRETLLRSKTIRTMAHLGPRAFGSISGEVVQTTASVVINHQTAGYLPSFFRLISGAEEDKKSALRLQKHRFDTFSQQKFAKIPGCPIAYWIGDLIVESFLKFPALEETGETLQGMTTCDNDFYIRQWHEVEKSRIQSGISSREEAKACGKKWFPYTKGGSYRKWAGNCDHVVNWENDGELLQSRRHPREDKVWAHNFNLEHIFREGGSYSSLSSGSLALRYTPPGSLFDQKGSMVFANATCLRGLLALMNSRLAMCWLEALCPTLDFNPGALLKLPVNREVLLNVSIRINVDTAVAIATADWDAYERSRDFQSLHLLSVSTGPNPTLESSYTAWIANNKQTIAEMKRLEEENNRLFIDAYGLQDELTPDVPIEQITLTVNPAYRYGGNLSEDELWIRFRQDTIKELLSYATGCMMGRYSLDHPGLILANAGDTLENYDAKVGKSSDAVAFQPDRDGIIPVLDGEWFEDDIVARSREFLRVCFPASSLNTDLAFIETSLGKDIRKYFCTDFYKDHLQTYKKRPIYCLVQSPAGPAKGGFACLIYLHRYTKDTLNLVLNNYFRPYLQKLEARQAQLGHDQLNDAIPSRDRTAARKEAEKITKVLKDCQAWEQDSLLPLAQQRIELDLDDGVKVNYLKLQDVLAPIPGLAAKEE